MKQGDWAEMSRSFSQTDVSAFALLTGDDNPIHIDDAYAAKTRFGRRIVHGMFVSSLISTVLGTKLPGPGAIYLGQSLKFLAPVFLGDSITARAEVISVRADKPVVTIRTTCRNAVGELVVEGEALLLCSASFS